MTGSDLDTELRLSAERTVESVLGAARAEARRLSLEAERLMEDRRREVMKDKEAEYRTEARVAIAAERHSAMRAVLLARTRLVDRVLEGARALLPEAAQTETYLSSLGEELTKALQFVDGDAAIVRCSTSLAPAVRTALRNLPEVVVQPEADLGTGFVLLGAGDSVCIDGRLETRLDRMASALAIEIHARVREQQR